MSDKTNDNHSTNAQTTQSTLGAISGGEAISSENFASGTMGDYMSAPFEDVDVDERSTQTTLVRPEEEVDECAETEQYEAAVSSESPIREKILALAEELHIDSRVIELPSIFHISTTSDGEKYVSDLNNVIQYFPESEFLRTSAEYEQNERMAYGSERANDLLTIYGQ